MLIGDKLRANMPEAPDEAVLDTLRWLECRRDAIVKADGLHTQLVFDMSLLIECLLFGACLRDMASMRKGLEHAIRIVARDTAIRDHLLGMLDLRVAPSPTTIRRHRLTLHVGFNLAIRDRVADDLVNRGVFRWGTLDSSPQGGWDWLMHGARSMSGSALVVAFRAANRLCDPSLGIAEARTIINELSGLLQIRQGVPTG